MRKVVLRSTARTNRNIDQGRLFYEATISALFLPVLKIDAFPGTFI